MDMMKQAFTPNTIGRKRIRIGSPWANTNVTMFQSIEIVLGAAAGKTMFQNLTQLDGAIVQRMCIFPTPVAAYSAQTYNTAVPTLGDYQAMFFTFMRGDFNILQNVPALVLNPFFDNDGTTATTVNSNPFWDILFTPQPIDFNKSYTWMAATPSNAALRVSLGVTYYYPNN